MTNPKLKPCPNCGQEPFLFGYEAWNGGVRSWCVECDPCPGTPGGIYIRSCEGRKLDAIRAHNASADTHPKGQDAKQGLAGTVSGAVAKPDAQKEP